jgi:spermidine synthase
LRRSSPASPRGAGSGADASVGRSIRFDVYAGLEFGIAVTALIYFGILGLFYAVYPVVYQTLPHGAAFMAVKLALALLLIFPPAFCMGGTLPAIGQHLIRQPAVFGRTAALIYGVNTFGAAVGVVAAAFVLVPTFGFNTSYAAAIVISAGVGVAAWLLARGAEGPVVITSADKPSTKPPAPGAFNPFVIGVICFLSGFGVLSDGSALDAHVRPGA